MKLTRALFRTSLVSALSLSLVACDGASDVVLDEDADLIADELELANGGLDFEDEEPEFDETALFAEAGLDDVETAVDDPLATDVEVVEMRDAPDAAAYKVAVLWGHADFTRDFQRPRNWSGTMSVNRGAIVVARAIRFDRLDAIAPRTDRTAVEFRSVTGPHHDGLRMLIIDPTPEADEPLTLTYDLNADGVYSVEIDNLLDGPISREVDDLGNRIVARAHRRGLDACDHGFMRGRWKQVARNFGLFRGRVANSDGELIGHMKGIYGQRRDGSRRFFGKYIGLGGESRGIFAGTYRSGNFAGRWLTRAGEHGVLGGKYRESLPGDRIGGQYVGRWAETSCNTRIRPDVPEDAPEEDSP